jgi:hypothetical protein
MGIFSSIVDKLLHHSSAKAATPSQATTTSGIPPSTASAGGTASASSATPASATAAPSASGSQGQQLQQVNVEDVLSKLAQSKGGGGNWRTSIVDLLKLLDLDSSLNARKTLANELNVHAGPDGSAEQNIALQKAVMRKLAENGGKVPPELLD